MNARFRFAAVATALLIFSCSEPPSVVSLKPFGSALVYDPSAPVDGGRSVKLTFWTQVDQEAIYQELIDDYTRIHPNVKIELVSAAFEDHFSRLGRALAANVGPDVIHLHNSFLRRLLPYLEPYPEAILPREALEKDFRQVDSHLISGKLYAIDTGLMTSGIFYNKKLWREAGLSSDDFPSTWTELVKIAERLTKRDKNGRIVVAGFNPNGIGFSLFLALNYQQGQPMFSRTVPAVPLLDTAVSRRSLSFLRGLYDVWKVTDVELPEFQESFAIGKAAMIYTWGWTNNWLKVNHPELTFGTFPLPSWTRAVPVAYDRNNGESSMGVNAASSEEKKAVAFDLIRFFLASDKYLLRICREFSLAPAKRSLEHDPFLSRDPTILPFTKIIDKTVWPGELPASFEPLVRDELIDPVVIDHKSPDALLGPLQRKLEKVLFNDGFRPRETDYAWYDHFRP